MNDKDKSFWVKESEVHGGDFADSGNHPSGDRDLGHHNDVKEEKKLMDQQARFDDFVTLGTTYTKFKADSICELAVWLNTKNFFTAPASTKYHGAYEGGLYDHSRAVALALRDLTIDNHLIWTRNSSPFMVGMLHDLCKCDCYKPIRWNPGEESINGSDIKGYEFNTNTLFTGHGEKSVMLLHDCPIEMTEEELVCIRYHMGAFVDQKEWSGYTNAIHRYKNVLWSHTADMLASHVEGV